MTGPIRLLVADDHPVVRDGLRGMLTGQPDLEVVGKAANGAEAVAMVPRLRPDVVLMDLRMPGMDGVEAIRKLRTSSPDVRVLVLTTFDTDVVRAIEAGATGYLLKDTPERSWSPRSAPPRAARRSSPRRWRPSCLARCARRPRRGRSAPGSWRCSSWSRAAPPTGKRAPSCLSARRR
jgi:CheY-like chemotaxis protein